MCWTRPIYFQSTQMVFVHSVTSASLNIFALKILLMLYQSLTVPSFLRGPEIFLLDVIYYAQYVHI